MNAVAMETTNQDNLWRVQPDPKRPGMYFALALTRLGQIARLTSSNMELLEEELIRMQVPDEGADLFLAAWKRGVALAGPDLFNCYGAPSVEAATDKNQLSPRWEVIEAYIRSGISSGERLFVMEMCSFYNGTWMQDWKKKLRMPRSSVGRCAITLDSDRRQVLADLLVNYRGW